MTTPISTEGDSIVSETTTEDPRPTGVQRPYYTYTDRAITDVVEGGPFI